MMKIIFHGKKAIKISDELTVFAEELFSSGVHVLACGGGVIAKPLRAIPYLKRKYTDEKLLQLSMKLLFEAPLDTRYPEGAIGVGRGIIYHLADKELLGKLIEMRRQLQPGKSTVEYVYSINRTVQNRVDDLEMLIAGVCGRLELPHPEDIQALDPQEEHFYFWSR